MKLQPLSLEAEKILHFLCTKPATVWDFADIAVELSMKRGAVETALAKLRHQRHGAILSSVGPLGEVLPARSAFLPKDAPQRAKYPALDHPEPAPPAPPPPRTQNKIQKARAGRKAARANLRAERLAEKKLRRQAADHSILVSASTRRSESITRRERDREAMAAALPDPRHAVISEKKAAEAKPSAPVVVTSVEPLPEAKEPARAPRKDLTALKEAAKADAPKGEKNG